MKYLLALAIFVCNAFPGGTALANDSGWKLDKEHSSIHFSVPYLFIFSMTGVFHKFDADLIFDNKKPSNTRIAITIQSATIDAKRSRLNKILYSADFFDVKAFPIILYKAHKVFSKRRSGYKLDGEMTIKGITNPIVMEMSFKERKTDSEEGKKIKMKLKGKLNRLDYNIGRKSDKEFKGFFLGKKVRIWSSLVFTRPASQGSN